MATTPEQPVGGPVSSDGEIPWEDMESAFKLPGVYTNRIYVKHLGNGLLRLNFAEIWEDQNPRYHAALVVTAADAYAFGELMQQMAAAALQLAAGLPPQEPPMGDENG